MREKLKRELRFGSTGEVMESVEGGGGDLKIEENKEAGRPVGVSRE